MPWRVIARVGLSRDGKGSKMRAKIVEVLEAGGFHRTKTGTWETRDPVRRPEAAATVRNLIDVLSRAHPNNTEHKSIMRYLWLYIDHQPFPLKRAKVKRSPWI
jgi:hypothetical protein